MAIDLNSVWNGWMTTLAQGAIYLTLGLMTLGTLCGFLADCNRVADRKAAPRRRTELRTDRRAA